jgi:hypothetical protein
MVVVPRWRDNENETGAAVCGDTVYQTAQPVPDEEYETIPLARLSLSENRNVTIQPEI